MVKAHFAVNGLGYVLPISTNKQKSMRRAAQMERQTVGFEI
jgi:hypothetical protein